MFWRYPSELVVMVTVVALFLVKLVARPALLTHGTPQESTT
ncbi:hypothetical protein [Rhodococcus opacus]|nr:hypothetical protein [Rhodococcus opacus]